ncbi:MAG: hypothetical protein JST00_18425 [Deltaproteobacteria bacterium]|nr:hypothetical protein [Deltaproteobacteria bacterium]
MRTQYLCISACFAAAVTACATGLSSPPTDDVPVTSTEPTRPEPGDASSETPERPRSEAGVDAPIETPEPDASAPTTFVTGTVAGVSISPAHGGAVRVMSGGAPSRLVIAITTRPTFCADYAAGIDHAGEKTLVLAVIGGGGASAVQPATYTVGRGRPSTLGGSFDTSARVLSYDASCQTTVSAANEYATSGTITITGVAGAAVTGTFSLTYPGGGSFTGAFDAEACTSPGADSFTCAP